MANKKDENAVLETGGYLKPEAPEFGIGNLVYRHTVFCPASDIAKKHADCFDVARRDMDDDLRKKMKAAAKKGKSLIPASHPCYPGKPKDGNSPENESLLPSGADDKTEPTTGGESGGGTK